MALFVLVNFFPNIMSRNPQLWYKSMNIVPVFGSNGLISSERSKFLKMYVDDLIGYESVEGLQRSWYELTAK